MTAHEYMHITAMRQFYGFDFSCFSVGCHMEEGQNLFDFLSAMIPITFPLNFETPPFDHSKRE